MWHLLHCDFSKIVISVGIWFSLKLQVSYWFNKIINLQSLQIIELVSLLVFQVSVGDNYITSAGVSRVCQTYQIKRKFRIPAKRRAKFRALIPDKCQEFKVLSRLLVASRAHYSGKRRQLRCKHTVTTEDVSLTSTLLWRAGERPNTFKTFNNCFPKFSILLLGS